MFGGSLDQAFAETGYSVCLRKPGRNDIHLYTMRAKLLCQDARCAVEGSLCRALRKKAFACRARKSAANEDYLPGLPLHHVLQRSLHREEDRLHLIRYLLFSLFPRVLSKGLHGKAYGSVADEHIDPSVVLYGLLYERVRFPLVCDIGLEYEALS